VENEVLWTDLLSPLLSDIAIADTMKGKQNRNRPNTLYTHAGSIVIGAKNGDYLQEALGEVYGWTKGNGFKVN